MRFSQRIGRTEIRTVIQVDTMDDRLKNLLYNKILDVISVNHKKSINLDPYFIKRYCQEFGFRTIDCRERWDWIVNDLNYKIYSNNEIWFFYDFIEWLIGRWHMGYIEGFNEIFEAEKSAYRFNDNGELIPITDTIELEEINLALDKTKKYATVADHLQTARLAYSNRENPDYIACVRESISAIESLVKIIVGDDNATLETALRKINGTNTNLLEALKKLYHFRGDQGGVAHGKKVNQDSIVSEADAKLILIIGHSIVNYLIANNLESKE
jgi:hypothetical protein